MADKHLLMICHRIPYPPNKGDKIRSFHVLDHLARHLTVHLAFLVDQRADLEHLPALTRYSETLAYDVIRPPIKRLLSASALVSRQPLSVPYFYSRYLQRAVDRMLGAYPIDAVFCSSSPTAEYLFRSPVAATWWGTGAASRNATANRSVPAGAEANSEPRGKGREGGRNDGAPRLVMDLIDVDSCKWAQYADSRPWPRDLIYRREARTLKRYEARIVETFSRILLTSRSEKEILDGIAPSPKVRVMANGVDLHYFDPEARDLPEPAFGSAKRPAVMFTGAMDYWPNVEGIAWFARAVWPRIRAQHAGVFLYIVGSNPVDEVKRLHGRSGIVVTGFVDDIRAFLRAADICVVPLLIARGIQNKVLEAMSMAKAVVCTPQALDGIAAQPGQDVLTAESAEAFVEGVASILADDEKKGRLGWQARRFVEAHHSWEANLSVLDGLWKEAHA